MKPPFIITEDDLLCPLSDVAAMWISITLNTPHYDEDFHTTRLELTVNWASDPDTEAVLCSAVFKHRFSLNSEGEDMVKYAKRLTLKNIAQEFASPQRLLYEPSDFAELLRPIDKVLKELGAELYQEAN